MTYSDRPTFFLDASHRSVRILIVATKSPDPPGDGGRLVLQQTLHALADARHDLIVVSPQHPGDDSSISSRQVQPYHQVCVDIKPQGRAKIVLRALTDARSLTVMRHENSAMRSAVTELLTTWRPDVVHAEQLQAFANCTSAFTRDVPVVLRMQNVESDLRMQESRLRSLPWLRIEADRLRHDERDAIRRATRTISLTEQDAIDLRQIAQPNAVVAVPPAFPAQLPLAAVVDGDPAVVLAGSASWWPNADGERWLLREVWPRLLAMRPHAILHIFGGESRAVAKGLRRYPAPADSQTSFPQNAIAVVPLRAASGIRLRVLESWARGLPVVATPAAARGLDIASGRELLIASTPAAFADSIARVHADVTLRDALVESGRTYLRLRHNPATQAQELAKIYANATEGR
jgi:polysaccharide biosynthesis protein PslH